VRIAKSLREVIERRRFAMREAEPARPTWEQAKATVYRIYRDRQTNAWFADGLYD